MSAETRSARSIPHTGRELAAVFIGGLIGTLGRAGLDEALVWRPGVWPWSTLTVNVAGTVLIAYAAVRLGGRREPPVLAQAFVGAGICGGLTTFSTLALELVRMAQHSLWGQAAGYLAASLVLGYAAVLLGARLARR